MFLARGELSLACWRFPWVRQGTREEFAMCDLNLKPEELQVLQKSDRCAGCGHLAIFHRAGPDWVNDYCLARGCQCEAFRDASDSDVWPEKADLPGIRVYRVGGVIEYIH